MAGRVRHDEGVRTIKSVTSWRVIEREVSALDSSGEDFFGMTDNNLTPQRF